MQNLTTVELSARKTLRHDVTRLSQDDLYLFNEGTHFRLWDKLGAHRLSVDGVAGVVFAVWAPNADQVCVMGDFNQWNRTSHPLEPRGSSGIWEGWIPQVPVGACYKYAIHSRVSGGWLEKTDPLAFFCEVSPRTASIVWDLDYAWADEAWMQKRPSANALSAPLSVYEVHLGSWLRVPEEDHRMLTYRELAPRLAAYAAHMGFTHVEFLPVMEHPFYGSWGYQTSGYFAPTSRYGSPQDFMFLIDTLHQHGLGVILDWVPSHFPTDAHGLSQFDGTALYEHADPRKGFHPDWASLIFNYGRHEVKSFLLSNALFWCDLYHIDALRVDAVASMIYLDYSRREGEWIPNVYGGRENLEALAFLRTLNEEIYKRHPDVQIIAEESTAWPFVSRPTYVGGLGFGLKWDMGWMHDTLLYMSLDPLFRCYHHDALTFRMLYAFTENFLLPLSHDEVVHGKGSLLSKMPGDHWQRFANLRLLLGYHYTQPGKKLLFMGGEFGQWREWQHDESLDWHLLYEPSHAGLQRWVHDLNELYRAEPALHALDHDPSGFEWIDCHDAQQSILAFLRKEKRDRHACLVVCNFTPVPRYNYRLGLPSSGFWEERLNSDATCYGGSGHGNLGGVEAVPIPSHGRPFSVNLTLPPLGIVVFKRPSAVSR